MERDAVGAALGALRREIDRIDEAMHRLLMERGDIIERLIETKRSAASGSAFRPDREASMLRVLAERHHGRLPLDAVEGIWRIIISTFTFVQAPFAVHACGEPGAMRDMGRFHFGFSVPYREHAGSADVLTAVAASRGDLGLVPLSGADGGAWWRALEGERAPKVIARLPFVERPDHPAGTPVLVVAPTGAGSVAGDVALHSLVTGPAPDRERHLEAGLRELGGEIVVREGQACLVAVPGGHPGDEIAGRLGNLALPPVPVGHHPPRFRLSV